MANESTTKTTAISKTLSEIDYGNVDARLGEKLAKLVAAVDETGLKGSMTITINVKKDGAIAVVSVESSAKIPENPMPGSVFFFGEEPGALHREDPRQLKLRGLEKPTLKTVEFPTSNKKGDEN